MYRAHRRAGRAASTLALLATVVVAARGCQPLTRNNPNVCMTDVDCGASRSCVAHLCQAGSGGLGGTAVGTGGSAGRAGAAGAGAIGGAGGHGAGAGGSGPDAGADVSAACTGNDICLANSPTMPICDLATKTCVGCMADADCHGGTPFCSTAKTCVACQLAPKDACAADAAHPFCGPAGACVACAADKDCAGDPTRSFCSADGACVGCAMAPAAATCAQRSALTPVCAATGACVACEKDAQCTDATKPFCSPDDVCVPCAMAATDACAKNADGRPFCGPAGACVECAANKDCVGDPKRPFCSAAGACVGCEMAPAAAHCADLNPAAPVCAPSGACVQCVVNGDCPSTAPVCSVVNACGACASDTDCAARGSPVVCMSHQGGRCATDAETIYVQNTASCSDAGNAGGTAAAPFCSMQPAVTAFGASRDLIVVRGSVNGATAAFSGVAKQVSIVGQAAAAVLAGANPAIRLAAGDAFVRDLRLTTAGSIGCQADPGSTLRLQHLAVSGNSGGGILLDGAAFDIQNTTVTNNGPGTSGAVSWGGILVNNPPAAGPKQLQYVTVQNNMQVGITCSVGVTGLGVFASGNVGGVDINPTCGFSACMPAGATCGAQP